MRKVLLEHDVGVSWCWMIVRLKWIMDQYCDVKQSKYLKS